MKKKYYCLIFSHCQFLIVYSSIIVSNYSLPNSIQTSLIKEVISVSKLFFKKFNCYCSVLFQMKLGITEYWGRFHFLLYFPSSSLCSAGVLKLSDEVYNLLCSFKNAAPQNVNQFTHLFNPTTH